MEKFHALLILQVNLKECILVKEFIKKTAEKLFENIPFSNASENARINIEKVLCDEYDRELESNDNSIDATGNVLKRYSTFEKAAKSGGYTDEEIAELISTDDVSDKKEIKGIWRKYKLYILIQSFFITFLGGAVLSLFLYHNIYSSIYNGSVILLMCIGLFVTNAVSRKFREKYNFGRIRTDSSARKYIESIYDKSTKKSINTLYVGIMMVFYLICILLLSVLTSKYGSGSIMATLIYHMTIIEVIIFLLLKNLGYRYITSKIFSKNRKDIYNVYIKRILMASVIYWVISDGLVLIFRNKIEYIINIFFFLAIIYFFTGLIFNFTLRKNITFRNIVVNKKRITAISLAVIIICGYRFMASDTYLTQSYINKISVVKHNKSDISYDDKSGIYTLTSASDEFKILQLTDIHLGGSAMSYTKDIKALEACYDLISYTEPDLVIVTGDLVFPMGIMSFSFNNRAPIMQFASFMRNVGIPWAFTYGNHDTETLAVITVSEMDELLKELSYRSSNNLLYPYIQPDIYGRSNQLIEIRNSDGSLRQAVFLIDSNDYVEGAKGINEYDYIHDDQVEWYREKVLELNKKEGHVVPSMIFFHIPLQEYKEANELYEAGSDEVKYYYGILGEKMIDKICCSDYSSKLFDTAVELGSTKAMFCGHDHYNNQSVEYKGIRLTYGYSIDYLAMPGIENDKEQRGATLITIDRNGEFDIQPYRLMDIK